MKPGSKGGYACDSNCLAYKSMKICSHCVGVALRVGSIQELVSNHRKMKTVPNLTSVADAGKLRMWVRSHSERDQARKQASL